MKPETYPSGPGKAPGRKAPGATGVSLLSQKKGTHFFVLLRLRLVFQEHPWVVIFLNGAQLLRFGLKGTDYQKALTWGVGLLRV